MQHVESNFIAAFTRADKFRDTDLCLNKQKEPDNLRSNGLSVKLVIENLPVSSLIPSLALRRYIEYPIRCLAAMSETSADVS